MSIDQAHTLFNSLLTIWGQQDTKALETIYHPDFIGHFGDTKLSREALFKRHDFSLKYYKNYHAIFLGLTQVASSTFLALSKQYSFDTIMKERTMLDIATLFELKENLIIRSWTTFSKAVDFSLTNLEDFSISKERKKTINELVKRYQPQNGSTVALLTTRELECLHLYLMSFSTKEIANKMKISPKTVDAHLAKIKDKLGFNRLSELKQFMNI